MSRSRSRRTRGFSLVELMVVLVIVGIMTGGASMAIDSLRANDADDAIERLRRVLEASAERAAVRGRPLAVDFVSDGYRFAELGTDGRWRPLEQAPLFVARTLPAAVRTGALRLNDTTPRALERSAGNSSRLVFGGRAPRFELVLADRARSVVLRGDPNGRVERVNVLP